MSNFMDDDADRPVVTTKKCSTCRFEPEWNFLSPLDPTRLAGRCGGDWHHGCITISKVQASKRLATFCHDGKPIIKCPLWEKKDSGAGE